MDLNHDDADTISVNTLALLEELQDINKRENAELEQLGSRVDFLHTSLLYYRSPKSRMGSTCYEAWNVLVKRIGGTHNTWKELGYNLGISPDDLNYISYTIKEDPSDIVLKVFMQNENGTLDKIINALVSMQRYDILSAVEQPLLNLAKLFDKDDSGYQSNENNTNTREIISYTKGLTNDLPPALNKNMILRAKDPNRPQLIRPLKIEQKVVQNDTPILFLTYMDDGLTTAFNIKYYVKSWTDLRPVQVITLYDRRDEVYQNPEKFIREYFEKADFVVPIVTSSYLQEIKSHNPTVPNTSDNLDIKYVNFIYNLIINHYIHASGCLNKKVRSVLPNHVSDSVFTDITMYPDLMPWTLEAHFNEQFQIFLEMDHKI